MKNQSIKTRFPPSPTGFLQMGNIRTALFNYLFAKQNNGTFVLRIEDTDKERSKKEYEAAIAESLHWLGLEWDEGIEKGGPHEPYRQSEKTAQYKAHISKLLEQGSAYYCFCTPEELEAQRAHHVSLGEAPRYAGTCRNLSKEEQHAKLEVGERGVIRFVVEHKHVVFQDLIRGEIAFDTSLLGDIVIAKDLETPLYNFTVVVDDHDMEITHVIRGEDHIANTPKQILLQEALGFAQVQYAHLPLLLGPDRTKLSKRHGDTSLKSIREEGYLPEAVLNFLVLLGWNPGDERELFSLPELVREFSLERVQKGAAVFNIARLDWMNGMYIRNMPLDELTKKCEPYVPKNHTFDFEKLKRIVGLYHDRLKKLSEITELVDFFFVDTPQYEKELLQWKQATDEQTKQALMQVQEVLQQVGEGEWVKETLEQHLMPEAEKFENRGYLLWPLRAALTGKKASAGPFEVAAVLGKQQTLARIKYAASRL